MERCLFTCNNVRVQGGKEYASSVDGWLINAPAAKRGTTNDIDTITMLWTSIRATGGVMEYGGSIVIWVEPMVSITTP